MHFRTLDSWRGVAALLVALFHLNVYSALYSLDFVRNGYLFVDFFFVLSGFVITHSYAHRLGTPEELGAFAIKRLGRLWPLHVVVLLAFVIAESGKALMAARGASFFIPPFTGPNSLDTIAINLVFAQSIGIVPHLTWNPSELEHFGGILDLPDLRGDFLGCRNVALAGPFRGRYSRCDTAGRQRRHPAFIRTAWHRRDL